MFLAFLLFSVLSPIFCYSPSCKVFPRSLYLYDGRSDIRETYEGYPVVFCGMLFHLGVNGIRRFVERGFEFAKQLATTIIIPPIEGVVKTFNLYYKVSSIQLQNFEVKSFGYMLSGEDNSSDGVAYIDNGEILLSADLLWKLSFPPVEGHYYVELSVKNLGFRSSVRIDSPSYKEERFQTGCPYHLYFDTLGGSSINLGNVSIKLTSDDGSGGVLEALVNVILPAFIAAIQDELGDAFISSILEIASGAIWDSYSYTMVGEPVSKRFATDSSLLKVYMANKGISAVMGGYYYMKVGEETNSELNINNEQINDHYIIDEMLPYKNAGKYSLFPSHPTVSDMSFSFSKHAINSFFYQVAKNDLAYVNKKILTKDNCEMCKQFSDEQTPVIDMIFNEYPIKVLQSQLNSFDDIQLQAYDNLIQNPNKFVIGYGITRNKDAEQDPMYDFPKVTEIGAAGMLLEGQSKVKLYIVDKTNPLKPVNVLMDEYDNISEFVLHPYSDFFTIINSGSLDVNMTVNYFDFIFYGMKDKETKQPYGTFAIPKFTSSNDYDKIVDNRRPMETAEIVGYPIEFTPYLLGEDNNMKKEDIDRIIMLSLLYKNIIGPYLAKYFKENALGVYAANTPMYRPGIDSTYYTYKKDYFVWNCDFSNML